MPLSLFDHKLLAVYRERANVADDFGHMFGGTASENGIRFVNLEEPLHLIYRLNLADPAVAVDLPGLKWLPLCYGFAYAAYDGTIIYRVLSDTEIELIAPQDPHYDPHFPYEDHPPLFPRSPVSFARQPYDPTIAEDALRLAAVFGVDRLPEAEMQRAVAIAEKQGLIADWRATFADWSPENIIRCGYKEPFAQGAPLKSCDNPSCTAEIEYRTEPMEITFSEETAKLFDDQTLKIEAYDVRRDSMRVFALHQPEANDELMWGDPYVQLIFEICDVCHCIRVSNQCT
ncbi:MAG TPA: hypothetical protein VFB96_02595 [Pirellulaceae bacterium]|nr:hypothetical protein [Pirellulaceae bacterium]